MHVKAFMSLYAGVALTLHAPAVRGQDKPGHEVPRAALPWETEASKSYLVPALEIPAFILLLNGYDRLVYPDEMSTGGEINLRYKPVKFLGPHRPRTLGD